MKEDIDRISGRMVHRAAAAVEFLEDVAARKRILERRTDIDDAGRAIKLEHLDERADRLARAANDYRKADKALRALPLLLAAAELVCSEEIPPICRCRGAHPVCALLASVESMKEVFK